MQRSEEVKPAPGPISLPERPDEAAGAAARGATTRPQQAQTAARGAMHQAAEVWPVPDPPPEGADAAVRAAGRGPTMWSDQTKRWSS
jgi:hypothetical protein